MYNIFYPFLFLTLSFQIIVLKGKKIVIAISGSIAAYKIPNLVRLFIKAGAEVKCILTPSATNFVSPLVLSTLSKNDVLVDLSDKNSWSNHVMLGRWADVILIAPASANTIAKMANGICDNLLLAVYLSATCPVIISPAMDEDMWHHKSLKNNLITLISYGNKILESPHGELASGLFGFGRMQEPENLFKEIEQFFEQKQRLQNKIAIVTAGPTYENIDPVRFIGNHSSGKMGVALAEVLADEGCKVYLILGPSKEKTSHPNIETIAVTSAQQMFDAAVAHFSNAHIAVMSAAVADYTPTVVADEKIKKADGELHITLKKTKDILKHLGSIKKEHQTLIGFALESTNEKEYALKKLKEKNADAIVLNSLKDAGAGFGSETNKITIFDNKGGEKTFDLKSKKEVAKDIVEKILTLMK